MAFDIDSLIALVEEGVITVRYECCYFFSLCDDHYKVSFYVNRPTLNTWWRWGLEDKKADIRIKGISQKKLRRLGRLCEDLVKHGTASQRRKAEQESKSALEELLTKHRRKALDALFERSN